MNPIPFIVQGSNVTVVIDNQPHTLTQGQIGYDAVIKAIKEKNWDVIPELISPKVAVAKHSEGLVTIVDGNLYFRGEEIHSSLSRRIVSMFEQGFDIKPMVAFMVRLDQNPSARAVNELYSFLEKCNLPITERGTFLAYKKVGEDYKDVHSRTVVNKPFANMTISEIESFPMVGGKLNEVTMEIVDDELVVSMSRNKVDDVASNTCSTGLHFCSFDYLRSFSGERIVTLEIDPADVVSIPVDYNFSKGRTSKYKVIGEVERSSFSRDTLGEGPSVVYVDEDYEYAFEDDFKEDRIADVMSGMSDRMLTRLAVMYDIADDEFGDYVDLLDLILEQSDEDDLISSLEDLGYTV